MQPRGAVAPLLARPQAAVRDAPPRRSWDRRRAACFAGFGLLASGRGPGPDLPDHQHQRRADHHHRQPAERGGLQLAVRVHLSHDVAAVPVVIAPDNDAAAE